MKQGKLIAWKFVVRNGVPGLALTIETDEGLVEVFLAGVLVSQILTQLSYSAE